MSALPEGMTADKLRTIAGWLDAYDALARKTIIVKDGVETPMRELVLSCEGTEVQDDLRRWANEIEATDA